MRNQADDDRMNGSGAATTRAGYKTAAAYRRQRDDDMAET